MPDCIWCRQPFQPNKGGQPKKYCCRACKNTAATESLRFINAYADDPYAVIRTWSNACRAERGVDATDGECTTFELEGCGGG